jgi:hypothetical protein
MVPPVNAGPAKPVVAVNVVQAMVPPTKVQKLPVPENPVVAVNVVPSMVPPVNTGPEKPIDAVMLPPDIVEPANVPPVNAGPEKPPEPAVIEVPKRVDCKLNGPFITESVDPEKYTFPVTTKSLNTFMTAISLAL